MEDLEHGFKALLDLLHCNPRLKSTTEICLLFLKHFIIPRVLRNTARTTFSTLSSFTRTSAYKSLRNAPLITSACTLPPVAECLPDRAGAARDVAAFQGPSRSDVAADSVRCHDRSRDCGGLGSVGSVGVAARTGAVARTSMSVARKGAWDFDGEAGRRQNKGVEICTIVAAHGKSGGKSRYNLRARILGLLGVILR